MENVETQRERIERLRKGIRLMSEVKPEPEPTTDIDQYTKINVGVYPYYLWMKRNADTRKTSR